MHCIFDTTCRLILCLSHVFQVEEIVGRFGVVCISRSGSNAEKFIYDSDVLTAHMVGRDFCCQ